MHMKEELYVELIKILSEENAKLHQELEALKKSYNILLKQIGF